MDEEFTTQRTIELEPGQVACVLTLRKKLSVFDRVVSHKRGNTWHLSSCDSKFPMITNAKQVPAFQQAFERLTAKRKPGRQDKGRKKHVLFFALEISQYIDELSSIMGMDRSAVVAYLVLKAIAAVYAEIAREAKQAPDEKVRIIADDAK